MSNMDMPGMYPYDQFQFLVPHGIDMPIPYSNMNSNMNPMNPNMNPMNGHMNPLNAMNPLFRFHGQPYGDHGN